MALLPIKKACGWLKGIQNEDGGWGESCLSDSQKSYFPLKASTLTDTAWAVDALIAAEDQPTEQIQKGIHYLLNSIDKEDWTTIYPKGQAWPEAFIFIIIAIAISFLLWLWLIIAGSLGNDARENANLINKRAWILY